MKVRKFYLQNINGSWSEVQIEMSPNLVDTLDESLSNLTVALKINQVSTPVRPLLGFELREYDDETEQETVIAPFVVSADNVELVGTNPNRYKHNLSLIQKSEYLTHHEIRNTVFSTSLETSKFYQTVSGSVFARQTSDVAYGIDDCKTDSFEYISQKTAVINLSSKKITELKIKTEFDVQIPYFLNVRISRNEWHLYMSSNKPKRWRDIYPQDGIYVYGSSFPTLLFKHSSNQQYELNILSSQLQNGGYIIASQELLDWINHFQNGTITIEIEDAYGSSTFIEEQPFINQRTIATETPIYTHLEFELYFNTVEMSVYEVLETLLKQQQKHTVLYDDSLPLFKLPNATHHPELYDLMKNTSSPNFVFTQCTMYDALVEIFKLWDAIFYIDEDGYLGIEYYNEHSPIEEPSIAGKQSNHSEERFTNRLISYFQNTKINDRFPNSNEETSTAFIRSKTLGVPAESDFAFIVPKAIDVINSVKASVTFKLKNITLGAFTYHFDYNTDDLLDITDYVVESNLWTTLSNSTSLPIDGDWNKIGKYNSLSYTRGSNFIDVAGFFSTTTGIKQDVFNNVIQSAIHRKYGTINDTTSFGDFYEFKSYEWDRHDIKLAVSYIALVDGKLAIESIDNKYDGESMINQSNGSIDINKLGLNMVGLSLKLGQPTLSMTQEFSKWEDRVIKGQYFIDNNGDKWVANNCVYTIIKNDLIQTTIEFVKNFNSLATRIELNREKRLTNISNELTVKCEELYGEYIYYCDNREISGTLPEQIQMGSQLIFNNLYMTFGKITPNLASGVRDLSSLVTTINNAAQFIDARANFDGRKKIYKFSGTIKNNPTSNGYLEVQTNINAIPIGNVTLYIPYSSAHGTAFSYDLVKKIFVPRMFNDFNSYSPTDTLEENSTVEVYVLIDNFSPLSLFQECVAGAILTNLSGRFNITSVPAFIEENSYTVEYALITSYDKNNNLIKVNNEEIKNVAIPMVVYGSGNSVCFEMSFESPISAGTQLLDNYASGLWGMNGWFSQVVLYTDENGRADKFTIDFVMLQEETTRYFPEMKKGSNLYIDTYSFGKIEKLEYCKKPNEVFALNYQLHFLPYGERGGFLSNEFIKNNGFSNGLSNKDFYVVYSTDDFKYSILDTKGVGTRIAIKNITTDYINTSRNYATFHFNCDLGETSARAITSWAIVDSNNNIYYASNHTPYINNIGEVDFYITFFTRHHRLS